MANRRQKKNKPLMASDASTAQLSRNAVERRARNSSAQLTKSVPAMTYGKMMRLDGFSNFLTGLGTDRDKNNAMAPDADELDFITLENYYRGSDIAKRIVNTVPNEMTRMGWNFRSANDPDLNKFMDNTMKRLKLNRKTNTCQKLSRLYGTSYMLPVLKENGVDESNPIGHLAKPLDWDQVTEIVALNTFDAREVTALEWQNNIYAEDFGMPTMYQICPRGLNGISSDQTKEEDPTVNPFARNNVQSVEYMPPSFVVHASRLVRFDATEFMRGVTKSRRDTADSVLLACWQIIDYYATAWGSTSALMADFAQGVLKLKGVAEAFGADKEGIVLDRLTQIDLTRSSSRLMALDADAEDFLRRETPVGGLPDLLQQFALRVACCAEMPAALLMGQSPAGLNSTGAAEIRWFYDNIASKQQVELLPILEFLYGKVMQVYKKTAEDWNIKFRELWQPTAKETADVHQQMAQADSQYIANGVISADEVALSRFGKDEYGVETHININSRGGLDTLQPESDDVKTTQNVTYFDKIVLLSTNVAGGLMTRESAVAIMEQFFGMDTEEAEALLGPKTAPNPGTPIGGPAPENPTVLKPGEKIAGSKSQNPSAPTKSGNPAQPGKPKGLADKKKVI